MCSGFNKLLNNLCLLANKLVLRVNLLVSKGERGYDLQSIVNCMVQGKQLTLELYDSCESLLLKNMATRTH